MKKLIYLSTIALLAFGCDPYNDQFSDDYAANTYTQVLTELTDTLTTDDYNSFGGDVKTNQSFSEDDPAANYLPDFLGEKYPALDEGSAIKVTYNYYRGEPDYYSAIAGAKSYTLTAADYNSMGEEKGQPGQYDDFTSSIPPEDYLPDFLLTKYPDAESGDIVLISYKYYDSGTTSVLSDFYEFDGSSWSKAEFEVPDGAVVYVLTSDDYDSMGEGSGEPGQYNNFSSSVLPENYLSTFLSLKYPYAQEGDIVVVVYAYYASKTTTNKAIQYTKGSGGWTAYETTTEKTDQYIKGDSGWAFDPSVQYTMVSDDYQKIVDYVKANIGSSYVDSYGTAEDYYGSSAYYSEFRTGDGYFESSKFSSWEDAVKEAVGEIFLPEKYPSAVTQVDGIDVNYVITFTGYAGGASTTYTITFQCTTAGPNPEFTYVKGPTAVE